MDIIATYYDRFCQIVDDTVFVGMDIVAYVGDRGAQCAESVRNATIEFVGEIMRRADRLQDHHTVSAAGQAYGTAMKYCYNFADTIDLSISTDFVRVDIIAGGCVLLLLAANVGLVYLAVKMTLNRRNDANHCSDNRRNDTNNRSDNRGTRKLVQDFAFHFD